MGMLLSPGYSAGGAAGAGGAALGYALPVEALRGLVGQILALGKPSRPTLGVTLAPPQVSLAVVFCRMCLAKWSSSKVRAGARGDCLPTLACGLAVAGVGAGAGGAERGGCAGA